MGNINKLIKQLNHNKIEKRFAAAKALGESKDNRAMMPLKSAVSKEKDIRVLEAIKEALMKITEVLSTQKNIKDINCDVLLNQIKINAYKEQMTGEELNLTINAINNLSHEKYQKAKDALFRLLVYIMEQFKKPSMSGHIPRLHYTVVNALGNICCSNEDRERLNNIYIEIEICAFRKTRIPLFGYAGKTVFNIYIDAERKINKNIEQKEKFDEKGEKK